MLQNTDVHHYAICRKKKHHYHDIDGQCYLSVQKLIKKLHLNTAVKCHQCLFLCLHFFKGIIV